MKKKRCQTCEKEIKPGDKVVERYAHLTPWSIHHIDCFRDMFKTPKPKQD